MTALDFPTSPVDGQTYSNYIYDGTKAVWRLQPNIPNINSKFYVSATAPADPQNGEIWLNSTDGNTYIYYVDGDSSQWVEIGGNTGQPPTIDDLNDVTITSVSDNEVLAYDNSSSSWINQSASDAGLATEVYVQNNFGPKFLTETSEQTSSYTLALGDINKVVLMSVDTGTLTVPTNASVAFPVGTVINVYNINPTDLTIQGDSGVTVRNAGALAEYGEVSLRKRATDEWVLAGVVS